MNNTVQGRPKLLKNPKQITIIVEQEVYEALVVKAQKERLAMSELVRRAVDEALSGELAPRLAEAGR